MSSTRADRRRLTKKNAKLIGKLGPDATLIDFVVYAGADPDPGSIVERLPEGPRTVTVVVSKPHPAPSQARSFVVGDRALGRWQAVQRGRAPFIIFVDADVAEVTPTDVAWTVQHLESGAAAVGGLVIRGDRVLSAGYCIGVTGQPYFRFGGWDPAHAKVQTVRDDLQAVTFQYMGVRRDTFRRIGFKEFGDRAFIEADNCIRAKRAGLGSVVYDPRIRVTVDGRHLPQVDGGAVQLLLASAAPEYDEFRLL